MKKFVDFGHKIGGAKKDNYGIYNSLSLEELLKKDNIDLKAIIKKENVFPKMDYKELVDNGEEKEVVYFKKVIYDLIPRIIQDNSNIENINEERRKKSLEYTANCINTVLFLKEELGKIKTYDDIENFKETMVERRKEKGFNDLSSKKGYYSLAYDVERKADYYSTKSYRYNIDGSKEEVDFGKYYLNHEVKAKHFLDEEYANQIALKRKVNSNINGRKRYVPSSLKVVIRESFRWRLSDANESNYLKELKFYGIEFGNWLNSDERRLHMNYCYDAFKDLAYILGIDEKDTTFSKLGIGYGSRGVSTASAHYEPTREVINLTRKKGAGCLGHEWFHFLDNILDGKIEKSNQYITVGTTYEPINNLVKTILYRDENDPEYNKIKRTQIKNNINGYAILDLYKRFLEKVGETNLPNDNVLLDKLADYVTDGTNPCDEYKEKLEELNKNGDLSNDCIYAKSLSSSIGTRCSYCKKYTYIIKQYSQYYLDSEAFGKKYDSKEAVKKGYWVKTEELCARAFHCYLKDKSEELGIKNDYLTGLSEIEIEDIDGNTYRAIPIGKERERINQAFDDLFVALKRDGFLEAKDYSNIKNHKVRTEFDISTNKEKDLDDNINLFNYANDERTSLRDLYKDEEHQEDIYKEKEDSVAEQMLFDMA